MFTGDSSKNPTYVKNIDNKNSFNIVHVVVWFIVLFVVVMLTQLVTVYTDNIGLWQWRNTWNEVGSNSTVISNNKKVPWFYIKSHQNWGAWPIARIFVNPSYKLTDNQISFLDNELQKYQTFSTSDGTYGGVLTPRSYSYSIVPSTGYGDKTFDKWIKEEWQKEYPHFDCQNCDYPSDGKFLEYDASGFRKPLQPQYPYPSPTDSSGWANLILEWLNGPQTWDGKKDKPTKAKGNWSWEPGKASPGGSLIITFLYDEKTAKINDRYNEWNKTNSNGDVGRPDNFFARLGMTPDSTILTFWFNPYYEIDGIVLKGGSTWDKILGSSPTDDSGGGIIGWMKSMEGENVGLSESEYKSLWYSSFENISPIPKTGKNSCPGGKGTAIASGAMSGLGIMAMAMFVPGVGEAAFAAWSMAQTVGVAACVAAGAAQSALSATSAAASCS